MELSTLYYSFILVFFSIVLGIGIYVSKNSGKNSSGFFLGYIGTNYLDGTALQGTVSSEKRLFWHQVRC
jgi:hypothetical protein